MSNLKTLNELDHLMDSGFGRPHPRHGLKLLYWFAKRWIYFDGRKRMRWRYDPEESKYGFHLFKNRYDRYGVKLLPESDLQYYEVGNLSKPGACDLPGYVMEDFHDDHHDDSNIDRVIVRVDEECVDKVYITEHQGQSNYNSDGTYCISKGLLMIIKRMTLEDFLSEMGY